MSKMSKRITKEIKKRIKKLHTEGLHAGIISERLGISRVSVRKYAKEKD